MSAKKSAVVTGISLLTFLAVSGVTHAAEASPDVGREIDMVGVQSSYPSGYTGKIAAVVDDAGGGIVTGFHFSDSRNTQLNFTVAQLQQGVVLVQALGKEILKISGPSFTGQAGGPMVLTFLKGFFGSDRREVTFDYVRFSGASEWQLDTDDQQGRDPFDALSVKVGTTLGIPTGVDEIDLKRGSAMVRQYDPSQLPTGTFFLNLNLGE